MFMNVMFGWFVLLFIDLLFGGFVYLLLLFGVWLCVKLVDVWIVMVGVFDGNLVGCSDGDV